jgi:hypothetical protein
MKFPFIHLSMALQPFVGPWPLLQFRNRFYADSRTPWTSDQPVARPLPTNRATQTQNKRTQTLMPWVGFESTIPVFERAKTVHVLDGAASVIGLWSLQANVLMWITIIRPLHCDLQIRNMITSSCWVEVLRAGNVKASTFRVSRN